MMSRLTRIRAEMHARGLTALLVTTPANIRYLSGFTSADGALLITAEQEWLLTDFRYLLQAAQEAPAWSVARVEHALIATARRKLEELGQAHVGFEPDALTWTQYQQLGGGDANVSYLLIPAVRLVEQLRLVKSVDEVAAIRQAVALTDAAYAHLLTLAQPGRTEQELALAAEWFMRMHGADGVAFEIIVAAGVHSALPHAVPSARPLARGDLVIVDMGARCAGYCADMTRTFAIGDASARQREIYQVCLRAQLAGEAGLHAGMSGHAADALVREVIVDAGFGEYFGHGTGHGVGLEIHESPRLNRVAEEILPAGAAVTVEPGIYLPEIGGVRIEDLVIVTETGITILTAAPKPDELPVL